MNGEALVIMSPKNLSSDFLNYLAETNREGEDCERLPSLQALSKQLGVSVSSLREQMEVARALGLIEACNEGKRSQSSPSRLVSAR